MDNLLGLLLRILVIGIRLVLLVFSIVGWIVFLVGFVQLNKKVHRYYNPETYIFPDHSKQILSLASTLFIPMWVFVASGLAVYISLALHIIVWHQNIRHILHSLFMFFNVFYMFGGSGSMIVALAFSSSKTADTLRKLVNLDESSSKIVLYGASISIGMYWISTWLWPVFELRPRRRTTYAYQPLPQDEDKMIAGSHIQGRYSNYGSGRFSNSRELCQQVSQEYNGEYD